MIMEENALKKQVSKPKNKRRTRKVRNVNVGIVIILCVFIYMIINVAVGLTKDHISIYEVQAVNMSRDSMAEAVIIRNENNYYTNTAGYTNYYVRNGARVAVGDTIYSIDASKNIYDYLVDYDFNYTINSEDVEILKAYVSAFNSDYNKNNFSMVYDLKEDLTAEISNISDTYLLENLNEVLSESGNPVTFNVVSSDISGTVSFFYDSLDGITAEEVEASTFDKTNYISNNLYDSDLKENGSLVYKIIDRDAWSLVINLSKEQYDSMSGQSNLTFTIKNDGLKLTKPCKFFTRGTGYFAQVDMTDYLIRYIKYRFLDVELELNTEEGLKIPYSAITTKEFYKIPSEYYIYNEEAEASGFTYMEYDMATKETSYVFVEAECYHEDEENGVVYIDTDEFEYGQYIYSMENETLFQVSVIGELEGVYNTNKGYAVFRRIEKLSENDDYCIVKDGLERSLSAHDHIALHADLIDENLQIY